MRKALIEIVLSDLTKRDSIQSIASASQQLSEILFSGWESTNTAQQLSEILFSVNAKWITVFTLLSDISQEARHYCNLLLVSRRSKNDALSVMEMRLQQVAQISREISSKVVFISKEKALNLLLNNVVAAWQKVVQHEQEMLDTVFSEEGDIPNPYIAGPPLKYGSRLFVGRRDLAPQIEEALSKGNDQPTFLLYGERRMGKSSTLRQLPELLGTRYLPIFFDMQSRGISSSITDFFITVSREIGKAMRPRGMQVKRLDEARLQEASHRNEAAVYLVFDQWFEALERILEQENRTLLLTFDEFEKLEEAGQSGFLDLKLLLDWFRNATQHHPRLALLFSGVHPLEEMGRETGINWAGYLVNVQPLKVSFLYPDEARSLITRPTDDFPSERIFTEDVVDKIIDETHGHPFLVQALCSVLITNLNEKKRKRAEIQDVVTAVQKTLEGWWGGYFHDLWKRSDKNQQTCLHIIGTGGTTDWQSLVQDSGLDERIVSRTIEILLQRDLIVRNEDNRTYRIVAPIFSKWVQREYSITIQESYQGAKQDQSGYSSDMIAEEVILLRRENQALRDKVSWQQEQIDLQQGQMAAQQETISVQQAQLSQQIEQLQQQIRSAFRGDQLSKG